MIQFLKKRNRTLLELRTGMLFLGIICQIPGLIFYKQRLIYTLSLWLGVALAMLATEHMYRSLDKALDFDEKRARNKIYTSYILRYVILIAIFAVICVTKYLDPLVAFLGYMTLKFGAMLQPTVHKIYNKLFHETDPVPMTQEEYDAMREAQESETDVDEEDESCAVREPLIESETEINV